MRFDPRHNGPIEIRVSRAWCPVWERLRGQIYFGSDRFIKHHSVKGSVTPREVSREEWLVSRPSLEEVFGNIPEDRAVATAYREYGYRLREIADFLGVHYSTVSRRLKKQEKSGGSGGILYCKT